MDLLTDKLQAIKELHGNYSDVVENYNMGLILGSEMQAQIDHLSKAINEIKAQIKTEYGINDNAVNLLLTLNIR